MGGWNAVLRVITLKKFVILEFSQSGFSLTHWNAAMKIFVTDLSFVLCWVLKEENIYSGKFSQSNYLMYSLKTIFLLESICSCLKLFKN